MAAGYYWQSSADLAPTTGSWCLFWGTIRGCYARPAEGVKPKSWSHGLVRLPRCTPLICVATLWTLAIYSERLILAVTRRVIVRITAITGLALSMAARASAASRHPEVDLPKRPWIFRWHHA